MLIVYDSLTGNVERFVRKLDIDSVKIHDDLTIDIPFILVTYTIGFGEVPITTSDFLSSNSHNLVGVASSGNKNWGSSYAKSGVLISQNYNVPLILQFELSGTNNDVEKFKQEVSRFEKRTDIRVAKAE